MATEVFRCGQLDRARFCLFHEISRLWFPDHDGRNGEYPDPFENQDSSRRLLAPIGKDRTMPFAAGPTSPGAKKEGNRTRP